jgi:hypothetical protein
VKVPLAFSAILAHGKVPLREVRNWLRHYRLNQPQNALAAPNEDRAVFQGAVREEAQFGFGFGYGVNLHNELKKVRRTVFINTAEIGSPDPKGERLA